MKSTNQKIHIFKKHKFKKRIHKFEEKFKRLTTEFTNWKTNLTNLRQRSSQIKEKNTNLEKYTYIQYLKTFTIQEKIDIFKKTIINLMKIKITN